MKSVVVVETAGSHSRLIISLFHFLLYYKLLHYEAKYSFDALYVCRYIFLLENDSKLKPNNKPDQC